MTIPVRFFVVLCLAAAGLAGWARFLGAAEVSIDLPPETGTYRQGRGVELAQSFCVQCHSVEYTAIQPPMPAKFWKAEVQKMREKYAAPIPAELDDKLADYLVRTYGVPEETK